MSVEFANSEDILKAVQGLPAMPSETIKPSDNRPRYAL